MVEADLLVGPGALQVRRVTMSVSWRKTEREVKTYRRRLETVASALADETVVLPNE